MRGFPGLVSLLFLGFAEIRSEVRHPSFSNLHCRLDGGVVDLPKLCGGLKYRQERTERTKKGWPR